MFAWTDDTVGEMRRLFALGQTDAQIAKAIGAPSRNAVIGKRARLGLARGAPSPAPSPPAKVIPPARMSPPARVAPPARIVPPKPPPPPASAPEIASAPVSILDHQPGQCRWPLNDPASGEMDGLICCGGPIADADRDAGRVYCGGHHLVAHPPRKLTRLDGLQNLDAGPRQRKAA